MTKYYIIITLTVFLSWEIRQFRNKEFLSQSLSCVLQKSEYVKTKIQYHRFDWINFDSILDFYGNLMVELLPVFYCKIWFIWFFNSVKELGRV